jgi:hypothetical protein
MECQYLAWLKALHDAPMGLVQGSFEDVGEGNVGTLSVEVLLVESGLSAEPSFLKVKFPFIESFVYIDLHTIYTSHYPLFS